ncbi:protein adenylyltransferase SelO family protein [Sorangium sp. So ce321]|uniref:protein adenylyltransferase SelO family protein n=1 Tax=Sorangium sp. So ce321 TaxID=3133300 RepID=UPI003F601080
MWSLVRSHTVEIHRNCWQPFNDARISTGSTTFAYLHPVFSSSAASSRPRRVGVVSSARAPPALAWPQLLPARAAPRRRLRPRGRGARSPSSSPEKGRERTPWSRARIGHPRLALKGGARDVLATGTLEALGVIASRSITQAARDGRGALANGRAAHRASSNGESRPVSAGKLDAPAAAREWVNRVRRSHRRTSGIAGFLFDPGH